ncbi:amino acid permease [Cohnella sp.]|uniref:amino acid permease n=1 Tax=Cohnella sp. TaxID=1883426 RepID=UPI00356794D1
MPNSKAKQSTSESDQKEGKKLKWWQLSLLGVAFTIGTGYFLGSGIGIQMTGPSILLSFVLAAVGTYFVFDALSRMTAADPVQGSFRTYAKKAFGRWAGFGSGWVYWVSEMLITGSQMTALSLFTRFWFPNIPLWIFATIFAVLGLVVIISGTKGFERLENVLALMKIAAILMFILLAATVLFGWLGGKQAPQEIGQAYQSIFPHGFMGWWSSMIFAFYAFGGIEIMGIMAIRLKDPNQAPKAGKVMLFLLTFIYVLSLFLAIWLVSWTTLNGKVSPFIVALRGNFPWVPHVFNGVLIIAGFSTMVASLFAVTTMMVTLADEKDAPGFLTKKIKKKPYPAIGFTAAGMAASIVLALVMPERIYEYLTTAAGLMLLYNWLFILVSSGRILKLSKLGRVKQLSGIAIILLAVAGTVTHHTSRPGLWVSLIFLLLIGGITLVMNRIWGKNKRHQPNKA